MVLFAAVAANAYLDFAYHLPSTSSISSDRPALEERGYYSDLEKRPKSFSLRPASSAPAGGDPVVVGTGDIASCQSTGDEATARLIDDMPNATVLTLGDHAFEDGTKGEFAECYEPSWERLKERTVPTVGNHDYQTPGAFG
jgi:hypothetical protein